MGRVLLTTAYMYLLVFSLVVIRHSAHATLTNSSRHVSTTTSTLTQNTPRRRRVRTLVCRVPPSRSGCATTPAASSIPTYVRRVELVLFCCSMLFRARSWCWHCLGSFLWSGFWHTIPTHVSRVELSFYTPIEKRVLFFCFSGATIFMIQKLVHLAGAIVLDSSMTKSLIMFFI